MQASCHDGGPKIIEFTGDFQWWLSMARPLVIRDNWYTEVLGNAPHLRSVGGDSACAQIPVGDDRLSLCSSRLVRLETQSQPFTCFVRFNPVYNQTGDFPNIKHNNSIIASSSSVGVKLKDSLCSPEAQEKSSPCIRLLRNIWNTKGS